MRALAASTILPQAPLAISLRGVRVVTVVRGERAIGRLSCSD